MPRRRHAAAAAAAPAAPEYETPANRERARALAAQPPPPPRPRPPEIAQVTPGPFIIQHRPATANDQLMTAESAQWSSMKTAKREENMRILAFLYHMQLEDNTALNDRDSVNLRANGKYRDRILAIEKMYPEEAVASQLQVRREWALGKLLAAREAVAAAVAVAQVEWDEIRKGDSALQPFPIDINFVPRGVWAHYEDLPIYMSKLDRLRMTLAHYEALAEE